MLKWFNRKKKDNKGFSLVELVIVVAILAILVGILAPQYTKYVEKSRKAADASNLENIVTAFKVASADTDYDIEAGTYKVVITQKDGATGGVTITAPGTTTGWIDALKEYTGYTFASGTVNQSVTLKSSNWKAEANTDLGLAANTVAIGAVIKIAETGSVEVTYDPASLKDQENKTSTPVAG